MKSLILLVALATIAFALSNDKCVHFWFSQKAMNDIRIVYNIQNMKPSKGILKDGKIIKFTEVHVEKNHKLEYEDSKYLGCGFLIK